MCLKKVIIGYMMLTYMFKLYERNVIGKSNILETYFLLRNKGNIKASVEMFLYYAFT